MTIDASRTGTRMYGAPEYMMGLAALHPGRRLLARGAAVPIVVGDFRKPLGPGWQRDVPDALLAEDIAACVDVEPARRFASALQVAEWIETLEARRAARAATEAAARR